jgi:mono/diheme cytochrome c family protein
MKLKCIVLAWPVLLVGIAYAGAGDGGWLHRVPAKYRDRPNPLASDPEAALAGGKVYAEHCAECHGGNAEGKVQGRHYRPNLHSKRIKQATPGELFWLLTNGSLRNGMPSWSRFPEPERWQLVSYLKSLS